MPALSSRLAVLSCLCLSGCLFDSGYTVLESSVPVLTSRSLDTVVASSRTPARTVDLYLPVLDPSGLAPGAAAAPETFPPVNVADHEDSGRIVRYRFTRQRFGSWSPALEFAWNYFQISANWMFSAALPDTAGMQGNTANLYAGLKDEDRFTRYYDSSAAPAVWEEINSSTRPGAVGIMVKPDPAGDTVRIERVVAGSPADRAGLARGMAILAVDDSAVTGDSALARFARFNSGDSGSTVRLTVLAPGGAPSERSLVRVPVAFPTVLADSMTGVGYLALLGFSPNTVDRKSTWTELRDGLDATRRFPITILDLRDNGGGSVDVALRMCDEILPAGKVIIRQVQRRFDDIARAPLESEITAKATAGGKGETAPGGEARKYLLLANGNTASASEIFMAALREGAGTPSMGQTTFGKGIGQVVRTTPGQGLSLITVLKFASASGLVYNKEGLAPDYADSATGDALLAHAAEKARTLAGMAPAAKRSASENRVLRQMAQALEWNRRQAVRKP